MAVDPALLLEQLPDAVVVADASGTIRMVNSAAARLFGVAQAALLGRPLLTVVPPRFRAAHRAGLSRFAATGRGELVGGRPIRVTALRGDGSEVDVELVLGAVGEPGQPGFSLVATLRDMSRWAEQERRAVLSRLLQASVDAARDGVLAVSPDRRVLAVNSRFGELLGLPPGAVQVGQPSPALRGESFGRVADPDGLKAAIAWGHAHRNETQTFGVDLTDGGVLEGYSAPIVDDEGSYLGRVWYLRDDTERHAADAQRAALLAQLAAAQRAQRFLLDASAVLARATGFAEALESLAAVAVPTLGDLCLIDVVDEVGRITRMAAVHADPARAALVDELRRRYPPDPVGWHPSVQAMHDHRSHWAAQMSEQFLRATTRDDRHFQIVTELGFTSYMTVPLVADGQTLGTVTLVSAGSGRRFGADDLALAEELATRVASVVAKARRYDTERRTSHALQASLLPTDLPTVPGVGLAVRYLPGTRDTEVGGDFWDVTVMPTGDLALAVGDVAGHDITAAATMAQLRSACRALRSQTRGPDDLIRLVHAAWDQLGLDRMATAVFARLDPATGRVRIASAGHPPPLILDGHDAWYPALDPAAPFGAPAADGTPVWEALLPRGAVMVFFTDGLVEDRGRDLDDGLRRLADAARSAPSSEPALLADHILATMSGKERSDDVALLVVACRSPTGPDRP